ncbi:MAG: ImmA/IrrE family metallo-endopeptidase [Methylorubrum rhodinum]|uniref:ImmA/IrrE family metallo-endopeptidase n=1 Tax=Methylorubrum rhodinum TaxID=29428 RepID=UPI003BB17BAA
MNAPSPAERLLMELGIERPQDIDLEAIASDQGVFITYRQLDGCEARIVGNEHSALISVNSGSRSTRQRFSVAHELGHWHHHRGKCLFCSATQIGNPANGPLDRERQADDFASDLLLPDFMVRPLLMKMRKVTLAAASEIADVFNVSRTAVLLRIVASNRFPVIVVCHQKGGRKWFRRADMVQPWWFPQDALDAETFAHAILLGDASDDVTPRRMPAEAWFSFKGADRHELLEQSFRLPGDQVLTVLTLPEEATH